NLLDFHNKFNENRSILSVLKDILYSNQTINSERKTKIVDDFFTLEALIQDSIKWKNFYIYGKENKYWSESFDNYKKYVLVSGDRIINSVLEELKIISASIVAEQKNNIQEIIFVLEKMLKEYRLTGITSNLGPKSNMSIEQEELLNILDHISERPASFYEVRLQIKNLMISIYSQEGGKALREVFACFEGLQCLLSDTKPDRKNTDPAKIGLWQCLQNFSNNIEVAWGKIIRDLQELGIITIVQPGHLKEEIHAAIRDDKLADLKNLVLQGADLNYLYEDVTPLMLAIMSDRDEIFDFLLENNVDLEATDPTMGSTALMFALVWQREDMAISLLSKGANPETKNNRDQKPLIIATNLGLKKVVRKLLERKVSLNVQNKDGLTPLEIARKNGQRKIVEILEREQELRKHWEFM
ncbi:MAG: ankyrin repeat domain-containing protein, partial [Candidatus Margulisbacteria bacterium]|nr:ankyrin repeat domain-containing protein [Candidatus Margulisiibacteriota bacterium]